MLWNGGISFGGVISFIFADLIIIPILVIYRKYYGTRMMLVLLGIFYATMVIAGYVVEFAVRRPRAGPGRADRQGGRARHQLELHDVLNIVFLLLAAALLVRFFRSGGGPMLAMMGGSPEKRSPHAAPGPAGHMTH